ncbi:transglutaminase-like domain-containing protein [Methylocella sp.]|uniref:transglutaminase-like domain-containing protein n=1 Tax=Methylocella sp. TaxID=1978226 RepID=UPI0037845B24
MTSRRDLLKTGAALAGALAGAAALPRAVRAEAAAPAAPAPAPVFAPKPGAWRAFSVVTRLDLAPPADAKGPAQAWIPLPSVTASDWMVPLGDAWAAPGANASVAQDPRYGAKLLHVVWPEGTPAAVEVTSRFKTRDRAADFARPAAVAALSRDERALFTGPTDLIPTDGIVKATSDRIVAGRGSDVEKARAVYEWVVENAYRKASTRGCGTGDIASLIASGDLGGKCADLNALFVGLLRAADVPARDLYGLRVAPSAFGYKSLGANAATVSKAQHCRSEVWLEGFGWVAADPADVRKVALEEPPGNNPVGSPKVAAARAALFGGWEGNWLAYNDGHDLSLPGSRGPKLGFLMYPQAEIAGVRFDCLDPDGFRYVVTAREIDV